MHMRKQSLRSIVSHPRTEIYACITHNFATFTQIFMQQLRLLRSNYATFTVFYVTITQTLRRNNANKLRTLRKIRRGYANNLRNYYADITQCLRKITQRRLRTIRNNYANVFPQSLHTFPMLTQLYYADITQILRK